MPLLLHQITKPISEFLDHLQSKNIQNRTIIEHLSFRPDEKLLDVIQKILITSGQLLWIDDDMMLKGMLSLQEIFKMFLT